MRIGLWVLYALSAFGWNAVAQDPACIDLNRTAMDFVAAGRLGDAESALSAALAGPASGSERVCDGQTLHNLATVVSLSERLAEAEILEQRSLRIFERAYPPGDPRLLRPLLSLARIQFERREIARARETYQRLQSISTERAADRAMVHGLAAMLLHIEGRSREAEAEYLKAVGSWEESGRGETAAVAGSRRFSNSLPGRGAISRSRPDTGPFHGHRHSGQGCSRDGPDQTLQRKSRAAYPAG